MRQVNEFKVGGRAEDEITELGDLIVAQVEFD
jgi:hypothetical protein